MGSEHSGIVNDSSLALKYEAIAKKDCQGWRLYFNLSIDEAKKFNNIDLRPRRPVERSVYEVEREPRAKSRNSVQLVSLSGQDQRQVGIRSFVVKVNYPYSSAQCYEIFTSVIYGFSWQARVFVPYRLVQPSLMFVGKARNLS
jgi:hypothetical protein